MARAPSHSADRKAGLFALEDAHIINGVQTTIAIDTVSNDGQGSNAFLEKAWVFVQIIDMAGNKNGEADLITRFSNTQNKIEIKDFVSRDPEQKRLFEDLRLSGIDYLYKTGAILENKDPQILLDEAIQAQACATNDLYMIALLKVNASDLLYDITKPLYKTLFNEQTNSFALYNNVQALRIVDNFVAQKKSSMTGKEKLTLIYGNILLLFYVLKELAKISGYEDSLLNISSIANIAKPICQKNSSLIYKAVLGLYMMDI